MKKQQIAAAACLVAGAIGFAAVYSTQKPGKDEIPTEISQTSSIVEPTEKKTPQKTTEKVDSETKMGQEESAADVYKRQVFHRSAAHQRQVLEAMQTRRLRKMQRQHRSSLMSATREPVSYTHLPQII